LGVGVEGQLAELEEVEGAGGAGLLGFGVGDYGGEAFDWALLRIIREAVYWCSRWELTRTTTPPQPRPLYRPTGKSWGTAMVVERSSNCYIYFSRLYL